MKPLRSFLEDIGAVARRIAAVGPLSIAVSAYRRFDRDDGFAMAGYIAYSAFLSVFPFAIFATTLTGLLIGEEETQRIVTQIFRMAPEHIAMTLSPVITDVTSKEDGSVLTFAALGTLWVASNAVEAVRVALDRAYEARGAAGYLRRRAMAIVFVFVAALTFAVLGFLVILAPLLLRLAWETFGIFVPDGLGILRYALGVLVFAWFLFLLNKALPSRRPRAGWIWPGVLVSTALWIAAASAFSTYLHYAPSYSLTYGAFAGVILTLLFFYITSAIVIFGAEVNAALIAGRRRDGDQNPAPSVEDGAASGNMGYQDNVNDAKRVREEG